MNELPKGWVSVSLSELADLITKGTTPTSIGFKFIDEGIRFVKVESLLDGMIIHDRCAAIDQECHAALKRSQLDAGDILFSIAGTLARVAIVGPSDLPANTNQALSIIRLNQKNLTPYVQRYLASQLAKDQLYGQGRGTGLQNLNLKQVGSIRVALAPEREQRRIVSKLDSLFARTRRTREELSHIPRLIAKYKKAILEAAFLQAQQASQPDLNVSLGELAVEVRNGLSKKPADSPPGTPILRISSVRPMAVNLLDRRFYPTDEELSDRVFLEEEDLLFTRYNGNPDFVAVCGKVTSLFEPTTYPDKLIRVRLSGDIIPAYAELICSTPQAREALRPFIKTAAGQHGISGKDLKKLKIPVPTLDAQEKINAKAREQLSGILEVANQTNHAEQLLDHLDRANLGKAFRGELVPQDPNDEPASVLLERICAARAQQPKNTRKGRGKTANARVAA